MPATAPRPAGIALAATPATGVPLAALASPTIVHDKHRVYPRSKPPKPRLGQVAFTPTDEIVVDEDGTAHRIRRQRVVQGRQERKAAGLSAKQRKKLARRAAQHPKAG